MNNEVRFPEGWPTDCPPPASLEADGVFFRTINGQAPAAEDFLTYHELGKKVSKKQKCEACGISLMASLEDAIHHRDVVPGIRRFIASGRLSPNHGRTLLTPMGNYPSHTTWWPFEAVDRAALFGLVEE
jgi:hypothetical protein